jgi:plasmid stabilization system protein ParE
MTYLVFLEEEAEAEIHFLQADFSRFQGLDVRFDRALASVFSNLETFPKAFPVVAQRYNLELRRILIKGFSKGLLYVVLDDVLEVRVLNCYDLRSQESTPRQTRFFD